MANREALRDLQTRLASRLQEARSQGATSSWLAVRAGRNYLFPLVHAGEIFGLSAVQPVPYAQHWFMGVMNLRGGLFGVVDLAAFVGGVPAARSEQALAAASVVTFNQALEINCALMVEGLAGLRKPEAFGSVGPAPAGSPAYFGSLFTDLQGTQWQEINLQALSQMPAFLSISA